MPRATRSNPTRDQAPRALEGAPEHRLLCDRLHPRIEGRELHLLERLGSPGGYEAPAHRDERSCTFTLDHRINRCGRTDVVARLCIARGRIRRQPIQLYYLWPFQLVGEASAHDWSRYGLCLLTASAAQAWEPLARLVIGYGEDTRMTKADYRIKAGECYRMAALAPSPADQATWLKLASEWLANKQRRTPAGIDRLDRGQARRSTNEDS